MTAPKPPQPIEKGLPAAGLIAHVAVCKYSDHLPLHRQEQIFARHGLEIARSTTCDWMAAAAELLKPLYDEQTKRVLKFSNPLILEYSEPLRGRTQLQRSFRKRLHSYFSSLSHER